MPILLSYTLLYCIMAIFCYLSPYAADDFGFDTHALGLKETFLMQWKLYIGWNGRILSNLFNSIVLLHAPWVHVVLTPFAFIGILFAMELLIWGKSWKNSIRWWHSILLFSLIWKFTPAFGQAFLWRTGAATYCYTALCALIFLIPFRLLLDDPHWKPSKKLLCVLAGISIWAGWSNENLGMVNVIAASVILIYVYRSFAAIPRWAIFLLSLCLLGWIALVIAPGNYARLASNECDYYRSISIFKKIVDFIIFMGSNEVLFLPLSLIVLCSLIWNTITKQTLYALFYFFLAQLSICPFLFSPVPANRSLTATSIFICLASATILITDNSGRKVFKMLLIILFVCIGSLSVVRNVHFFIKQNSIVMQRKQAIQESLTPIFKSYYKSSGKYFFPNSLDDVDAKAVQGSMKRHHRFDKIILSKDNNKE